VSLLAQVPLTEAALAAPILVLGAPRSGTTWLAKILDSHPGVVYRHEPDKALPPAPDVSESGMVALVRAWAASRRASVVTKRPFFAKAWQPWWARGLRTGLVLWRRFRMGSLPDLATGAAERVVLKSIALSPQAGVLARALPDSRVAFILRHPCGQVASVMRGNRMQRFDLQTSGTDMPFDEAAAVGHAAAHGVDEGAFQALPDAAKYAWSWRAFNEAAYDALASLPNVQIVLYEGLCAQPAVVVRRIFDFVGLEWSAQVEDFLARSTSHDGRAGYYAVYRNAVAAAEAWRQTMDAGDIAAVRSVVAESPLARFWLDLAAPVDGS
jgi:LPS sulfotransferase NodH